MSCDVSEEQLWCWIDDDAPELAAHLAECPQCRKLAEKIRAGMNAAAIGAKALGAPLPEKVGSYVIKGLLGEGGQGIVYEAEQQSPQRSVALKVLKGGRFVDRHDIRHFQREIQSLAALNHSGIATVYEAGRTEEGQYFFSMELVAGQPLDRYARDRDLPRQERLELFGKVCDAVQYAHEQGVIHRDLKPTNVLVGADGDPKILDFGLAQITEADVTLTTGATQTGRIMGTLRYMSPEQARGQTPQIDARSDVYALGVILYELLTDRAPYEISQFMPEAVQAICERPPQKPSSISRTLRGDLETIVLKALEKEPPRRYQSVEELGEDLRRYISGEPILAKPPSGLYVLRKKLSKHRLGFSAGAVVVILGLSALLGGISWKQHELAEARQRVLAVQHRLDTGDVRGALGPAREEFAKYPDLPDARLVLAHAQFRMFRELGGVPLEGGGIYTLRQGINRSPSQMAFHALLAEICRHTNIPEAEKLQEQVDRDSPDTAEAWYLLSLATMHVQKAVQRAEQAVERDPGHRLAWERLAYAYLQTEDFDGALRAARELMHLTGDHLKWTIATGRILLHRGHYREAIEQYARAADLDPGHFWPYRDRGVAHLCLREYPKAIEYYSKAVDLSPRTGKWERYQRATPLWIMGKTRDAAADYREVCRLLGQSSYADARLFLVLRDQAEVLDRQDQVVEARRVAKEANDVLEAASRGASAGSWLASIMACLAERLAPDELMDLADPGNPAEVCEAYYYAGEAYRLSGQLQKSRECFANCVRTSLVFDPVRINADPMNEYHLALWRLEQLSAKSNAALPNDGD